jgi:hypothetical protein
MLPPDYQIQTQTLTVVCALHWAFPIRRFPCNARLAPSTRDKNGKECEQHDMQKVNEEQTDGELPNVDGWSLRHVKL